MPEGEATDLAALYRLLEDFDGLPKGESRLLDVRHDVGLGTRLSGWVKGIKPLGKEVDDLANRFSALRARLVHVHKELERSELRFPGRGGPVADFSRGGSFVVAWPEGHGLDSLINEIESLAKESASLRADSANRVARSLRHRHPELVGTRSYQEETFLSALGGTLHGSSRTYNTKTVTNLTYPPGTFAPSNAMGNLSSTALKRWPVGEVLHIRVLSLDDFDKLSVKVGAGLEKLRNLAQDVGEPARR